MRSFRNGTDSTSRIAPGVPQPGWVVGGRRAFLDTQTHTRTPQCTCRMHMPCDLECKFRLVWPLGAAAEWRTPPLNFPLHVARPTPSTSRSDAPGARTRCDIAHLHARSAGRGRAMASLQSTSARIRDKPGAGSGNGRYITRETHAQRERETERTRERERADCRWLVGREPKPPCRCLLATALQLAQAQVSFV